MNRTAVIAAIAGLAAAAPALPQIGASRFALATVSDQRGRALVDIGADDFAVEESGAAREVLSVRPADYPIVVMIDTAAGATELADLQRAATQFVARLGAERAVAIVVADPPRLLASFDDPRSALTERVGTLQPAAASDVSRALALSAQTAHAAGPLFSAIVALCPTAVAPGESGLADALGTAVDHAVTVHAIERAGGAGGAGRADGAGGESPLRRLAEDTHGEYALIYSAASYQAALNRLADRLTTEVLIEYLVPVGSKPADVKLGVRVPGARVRGLGVAPR